MHRTLRGLTWPAKRGHVAHAFVRYNKKKIKMKKLYILAIGMVMSNSLQSQNYIPLLIDSLHTWSWSVDIHGDTLIGESWAGFSYDSNDSLIQRRNPTSRFNYSYGTDTVYLLSETLDTSNNWNVFSRNATAYDNGKIISKLTERFENNAFENSTLHTYFYENPNLDTLYLLQHWNNGAWVNFYKKEKIFDTNGNNTEEAEYYVDSNGDFDYNRGKLFEYDNANHRVQEIRINSSINGEYFTGRTNWIYGNDDLLDTIRRCNYSYPNNGTCNNVIMATYDYLGQDKIVENGFTWDDDEWKYYGKELTFTGQEIYSSRPDSVIFYYYWEDSLTHIPTIRRYLKYEDLGNDTIYFKEEEYNYFGATDEWLLTRLIEEWYHIKTVVSIDNTEDFKEYISIFPNPSKIGQNLTIKTELTNKDKLEVLVFDMQGKLVSRNVLINQSSFSAPNQEGIYTILIREEGRLIGLAKQVISK